MFRRSSILRSFKKLVNCKQITKVKSTNFQKKVALPVSFNAAAFTINELENTLIKELFKKVVWYVGIIKC